MHNVYGAVIVTESLQEFTGSSDECRTAPSGRRPLEQASRLGLWVCESVCRLLAYIYHRHLLLPAGNWYSFYRPTEGGRLSQPSHTDRSSYILRPVHTPPARRRTTSSVVVRRHPTTDDVGRRRCSWTHCLGDTVHIPDDNVRCRSVTAVDVELGSIRTFWRTTSSDVGINMCWPMRSLTYHMNIHNSSRVHAHRVWETCLKACPHCPTRLNSTQLNWCWSQTNQCI